MSVHYYVTMLSLLSLSRGGQMPRDQERCHQTEQADHRAQCPVSGPGVAQVVGAGAHLRRSVL